MVSKAGGAATAQTTMQRAYQTAQQQFSRFLDTARQTSGTATGVQGSGHSGSVNTSSTSVVSNSAQAGQTVFDPRSQINRLNSDGDRVVMAMTAEGKLQLPIPIGGVPIGIGAKGQYGFSITVQQVGDGTNGQSPQYEVTFDKNLLGGGMIEPPVPGVDPAAELNVRTSGSVTMRFDSKEDAARAVQTLQRLAASEAVRDAGSAVSPFGGGAPSNPFGNPITDTGFRMQTPSDIVADQIKPSDQEMAFLHDHVVSYTSRLGLQERGKIAAKFANLGIETRFDNNQTISRTVVLPQNGQPGRLTYTISGDLQLSTKEKLTLGKQQIDQLEIGYVPQNIVDHGQVRGEISMSWTLPAGSSTSNGASGPNGNTGGGSNGSLSNIPELSGLGAPDQISARLLIEYQTQGLTDFSRTDTRRLSITATTNNPGQHAGPVINSLLHGDVRGAFGGMGSDFTVTARNETIRRDGVHQQHELGIEVADVAEAKVSLEGNIGLDDITSRHERTWTGTDIANIGSPPVQGPQPTGDQQSTPAKPDQVAVVPQDGLNVRETPGGNKISAFQNGTFLQPTGQEQTDASGNRWIEVTGLDANDKQVKGWINAAYVQPHKAGAMNDTGRINPDLDKQGYRTHTVRPGDTIWDVAKREGVDFQEMARLNSDHLIDPNMIFPGDTLYIPGRGQPVAQPQPQPQPQPNSGPSGGPSNSAPSGGSSNSAPSGGPSHNAPSGGSSNNTPSGGPSNSAPSGGSSNSAPSGGPSHNVPSGNSSNNSSSGSPSAGTSEPTPPVVVPGNGNGGTSNRPNLDEVLRNYQMPTDPRGMVDWKPGAPIGWVIGSVRVTATEADMLGKLSVWELRDLNDIKDKAVNAATASYPPLDSKRGNFATQQDFNIWANNEGHNDAFRHAYWNALMTKRYGVEWTRNFANAHEGSADNPADREAMDLYNNEMGRRIAEANPNASDAELADLVRQAIGRGEMVVIDRNGNLAWSDQVAYGEHGSANDGPVPGVMPRPDANARTAS